MKMSYFQRVSPLLLVISTGAIGQDWDKARNNGQVDIAATQIDNLLYTADKTSTTNSSVGVGYDWLGLYEGFGVAMPVSVERNQFSGHSELDHTSYSAAPAVRLFVAPAVDVTLYGSKQHSYAMVGDEQAEFVEHAAQTEFRHHSTGVEVQFGHAPDTQNLTLNIQRQRRHQYLQSQLSNDQQSTGVSAEYSVLVSENSRLLLSSNYQDEQVQRIDTQLKEFGTGMLFRWSGAQQLKLVAGRFVRSTDNANDISGTFWQAANDWQFNEQWALTVSTSRHSELTHAAQSSTQLTTDYAMQLSYRPWQQHAIAVAVVQRKLALEQLHRNRQTMQWNASWRWQATEHWLLATSVQLRALDDSMQASNVRQNKLGVAVTWLW